ncbi:MAG TPA: hypothetical protein VGM24_12930 [Puia sp.]
MEKSFIEVFFGRMNGKLYFGLVILVQLIFIFQGLDFTDSGFAAVFYQRIFSDPSTVQYNFTYWLTGIIGGLWLKLFPGLGLLGLRIAGVICTTFTFAISYNLLKKYLQTASLRLGLLLIVLFLGNGIKEFNYRDISALFFICAAWFLFTGLTRQKQFRIFISGMFVAANMFARLPNGLDFFLILAIVFSGYLNRIPLYRILFQCLLFLTGFLLMACGLFLVMKDLHHDVFFFNNLEILRQTGRNQVNSRNLQNSLKLYLLQYSEGLTVSITVLVGLWSFAAIWRRMKMEIYFLRGFWIFGKYGILVILTALCIIHAWVDGRSWYYLFLFYSGTSLIIGFLIITGRQPKDMQLLSAIGCLMLLILPVGSHVVLMTVGKYAAWIMVPIAVDYLLNIRSLSSSIVVSENNRHTYEQVINANQMNSLRNGFIFLTLTYILSVCYFYPHADRSNRARMRYEINNEHASYISTTPERAKTINELLEASSKYVRPDDWVLAYDCLPMYYFLTDSRPFMHNSWVWLYDDAHFKTELTESLQETHVCPVVIMQKRSTLDNNWPRNDPDDSVIRKNTRNDLQTFLKRYQYRQVWENDFFRLYVPAVKNLPVIASGL